MYSWEPGTRSHGFLSLHPPARKAAAAQAAPMMTICAVPQAMQAS